MLTFGHFQMAKWQRLLLRNKGIAISDELGQRKADKVTLRCHQALAGLGRLDCIP